MRSELFAVNMNNSCLPQKVMPAISRKLNESCKKDQKHPISQHNIPSALMSHYYRRTLPDLIRSCRTRKASDTVWTSHPCAPCRTSSDPAGPHPILPDLIRHRRTTTPAPVQQYPTASENEQECQRRRPAYPLTLSGKRSRSPFRSPFNGETGKEPIGFGH